MWWCYPPPPDGSIVFFSGSGNFQGPKQQAAKALQVTSASHSREQEIITQQLKVDRTEVSVKGRIVTVAFTVKSITCLLSCLWAFTLIRLLYCVFTVVISGIFHKIKGLQRHTNNKHLVL